MKNIAISELRFKEIETHNVEHYLKNLKNIVTKFDNTVALCVDIDSLSNTEKSILFENGNLTPNLIYYWLRLIFEINKISFDNHYNSFWLDMYAKKYYDETIGTTLNLISNNQRWSNDNADLVYVWGDFHQKDIFNKDVNYSGIILPCMEGWGIIALLNDKEYRLLNDYFVTN